MVQTLPPWLEGSGLDRDGLVRAQTAGERAESLWRDFGAGPVPLLTGGETVEPLRHYPAGDVYDLGSHAQFYYHSHRDAEFGHIHLFQRPRGMPRGIAPAEAGHESDAPCHLIAIGFGAGGEVTELFTTNRWVTGEAWYAARSVKALVGTLHFTCSGQWAPVAAWLAALVAFYRPLIEVLVDERDRAVADWRQAHDGGDALADERLEVTSRRAVDIAADLARLRGRRG